MEQLFIQKLDENQIKTKGIRNWPIWEKEISTFDWHYDTDEECLILDGEVQIKCGERTYFIKAGDFVTFKKGLHCTWIITQSIRKYYDFP